MNDTSNEPEARSTDPTGSRAWSRPRASPNAAPVRSSAPVWRSSCSSWDCRPVLVLAGPPPIPTSFPSMRDFAQQLSIEDLLSVLVGVVWLAWLYFIVCVVVEVIAARRGGMARTVPLAGPLQKLAQALVGVLVMSGVMGGTAGCHAGGGGRDQPVHGRSFGRSRGPGRIDRERTH